MSPGILYVVFTFLPYAALGLTHMPQYGDVDVALSSKHGRAVVSYGNADDAVGSLPAQALCCCYAAVTPPTILVPPNVPLLALEPAAPGD